MKFSGKIEHGTSTEPLNFGGDPWPWQRLALPDCTLRAKICALRVLLVVIAIIFIIIIFIIFFYYFFTPSQLLQAGNL